MEENKSVCAADRLCITFRSRSGVHQAVKDFSFTLERGGTLAVVGQSGSGKTTLLRALIGLVPPSSGAVTLFGHDVNGLDRDELSKTRQRCGYVPQDPYGALPPGLTALEAVTEPARIARRPWTKDETRERARSLLAELGLTEERVLNSRAVGLSGGQRQRVELARALVLEPELLLCDEPTSMQDVSTRGEIVAVLESHVARGMSMVFVTHDLKLAAKAAKRIIVMHNGELCEEGESGRILNDPQHPYTRELIAAIPELPE
jgi:peptide/nickel transport system ATP-binding protein